MAELSAVQAAGIKGLAPLVFLTLFTLIKMFTGLVEIIGTVSSIVEQDKTESGGNGWTITVSDATDILDDCHLGDSIAINGKHTDLLQYKAAYSLTLITRYLFNSY